jgi:hypothetical protein
MFEGCNVLVIASCERMEGLSRVSRFGVGDLYVRKFHPRTVVWSVHADADRRDAGIIIFQSSEPNARILSRLQLHTIFAVRNPQAHNLRQIANEAAKLRPSLLACIPRRMDHPFDS